MRKRDACHLRWATFHHKSPTVLVASALHEGRHALLERLAAGALVERTSYQLILDKARGASHSNASTGSGSDVDRLEEVGLIEIEAQRRLAPVHVAPTGGAAAADR